MLHRVRFLAWAAAVAFIASSSACDDDDEPTEPGIDRTNFTASLSGANVLPTPISTGANGTATLTLFEDDSVSYLIQVASIDSVTTAHIHAGGTSTASGDVIVGFGSSNPPVSFTQLGTLYSGTIRRTSTFTGSFTFDSLLTRLNNGTAYVNVHTRAHPTGEIRGQLIRSTG